MATLPFIIFIHCTIFALCCAAASLIPLLRGHPELKTEQKTSEDSRWLIGLGFLCVLIDSIPIFWLFRAVPSMPGLYMAARNRWNKERSIRLFFYLSLFFAALSIASLMMM